MNNINVIVDHNIPKHKLINRIDNFLKEQKERFNDKVNDFKLSWEDDTAMVSGKLMGNKIDAKIHVEDSQVSVQGKLPLLVLGFKSKIEDEIREKLISLTNYKN